MPKFKPNTSPFKMSGYSYPGVSPLKHPHRTWKEAHSHDKNQPHPKSDITSETVVDNSGKVVNESKTEQQSKIKKIKNEGIGDKISEPVPKSKPKSEEVIKMPNPNVKPPGWGLDR